MRIQTSGVKLTKEQKAVLTNLIAGYHFANHTQLLEINLKEYEKEGKRAKYDVHIRASTDFGFFTAEGVEWKLNLAVKETLGELARQIEEFKSRKIEHTVKRSEI